MKISYRKLALFSLPFVFSFTGCAGCQRDLSSCGASNLGADWIIVQYGYDGAPINCWQANGVAITNEEHSDGIFWQDSGGHLIHISGWYNRVQVDHRDFTGAATSIGVELPRCKNGKYLTAVPTPATKN